MINKREYQFIYCVAFLFRIQYIVSGFPGLIADAMYWILL